MLELVGAEEDGEMTVALMLVLIAIIVATLIGGGED